ncbi:MAG: prepilin-type N-terminal cleavage/methylation domain-containing protein [Myxococcales bacterium]|nr:prepilin-type N-terminal cleavage/methylation domain-containing protein [Myxococcales bacterium]
MSPRSRQQNPPNGQRGTTLPELMIGLLILSLLTAVATPGIGALLQRQNLRNAAEDIMYAAGIARSRARASRRAYGLQVGKLGSDGEALTITVRRGTGSKCDTIGAGTIEYSRSYAANNTIGLSHVAIVKRAPSELGSNGTFPCFKPDGRMIRSDTGLPFRAPANGWFAGDVFYELRRKDGSLAVGTPLQVQFGYNGTARLTHGVDLSKLQGVN